MDIGVIFREQVQRERPLEAAAALSNSSEWSVHHIESGGVIFDLILARSTPAGLSCGWTTVHGGWTAWVAERTTLLELRRALSAKVSMDDADVMRAAIERWGFGAVERTNSVWAGAIWQDSAQELHFFRDRIGTIPVFLSDSLSSNVECAVLSTSMALMQQLCVDSRGVNYVQVRSFILGESGRERDDFFNGITRLHPGECLNWKPYQQQGRIQRYWRPGKEIASTACREQVDTELLAILKSVVADYFEVKCSVLTLVSGGLDSTLLLSLQVEQIQELGLESDSLMAATMGFPSFPYVDERRWTQKLQEYLNHPISVRFVEDRWPMRYPFEYTRRPELGPSFHPGEGYETEFIRRALNGQSVQMVSSGVGADHLFVVSDYLMMDSLMHAQKDNLAKRMFNVYERVGVRRLCRHLISSNPVVRPLKLMRNKYAKIAESDKTLWWRPSNWVKVNSLAATHRQGKFLKQDRSFLSSWDWELVIRGLRRKTYNLDKSQHLPYLRSDFVDTVLGLEAHVINLGSGVQKDLLRRITNNYLPESIRNRPKGGVFSKFVEFGLGGCEHSSIERLFIKESALADHKLIEPSLFLSAFASYRQFCWSHQGLVHGAGEMLLWRTVSAELWLRKIG